MTSPDLPGLLSDLGPASPDLLPGDLGASGAAVTVGLGAGAASCGGDAARPWRARLPCVGVRGVLRQRCGSTSAGRVCHASACNGGAARPRWAASVCWRLPPRCCGDAGFDCGDRSPRRGCVRCWRGQLVAACGWLTSVEVCWQRLDGAAYGGLFGCLLVAPRWCGWRRPSDEASTTPWWHCWLLRATLLWRRCVGDATVAWSTTVCMDVTSDTVVVLLVTVMWWLPTASWWRCRGRRPSRRFVVTM